MSEFVNIRYISGIPGLLKKIGCKLVIDDKNIKVSRFGKVKTTIKLKDIIQIEARKETDFAPSEMKDKTVIGRALAGGLLLGPFGALLGGMSGIGEKTKKQAKTSNNWFVLIAFQSKGVQNIAIFLVEALIFKERVANKIVNEVVTKRQEVLSISVTKEEQHNHIMEELSIDQKLVKLKSLYESELISADEYSKKKNELLQEL